MFSGQNVQMADHLAPLLACLDRAIAHLRATHKADDPGYCLAFISNGEVLRQFHRGMAHLEWQQPIAGNTRFYLASESKPWVAAMVMNVIASGKIQLDQTFDSFSSS